MKHYIVTGSSKGLGKSIVEELFHENHQIHCISRYGNSILVKKAEKMNANLLEYLFDLNNLNHLEELVNRVFSNIDLNSVDEIALINNAGVIHPITPIERCDAEGIISNIHVNLIAPMLLTKGFIQFTENLNIRKTIMNISSGAGKRPVPSWSSYCSSKAGLDLFSRTVAAEQVDSTYPVKVISVAPGVVDTNMQDEIRSSNVEDFSSVEQFRKYKEEGNLFSPEMVATKLVEILNKDSIENGSVLDVRQFMDE